MRLLGSPVDERARELDPVAARAGDLQRVEHEVALADAAMSGNFEVRLGLAVLAGEHDVHHARTGAAREENLDGRRHDLGFGLAGREALEQRPEAFVDDVHRVANLDQFFFALDRARHVEVEIEGNEFERALLQFAIIAHGHDVVEAVDGDALPACVLGALAQPAAGNVGPDFFLHERLLLVADPAGFLREDQRRLALQRDQDVDVAMNDLEARGVEDRAFESGVLIAANDERVDILLAHGGADVVVAALDFRWTRQMNLHEYFRVSSAVRRS